MPWRPRRPAPSLGVSRTCRAGPRPCDGARPVPPARRRRGRAPVTPRDRAVADSSLSRADERSGAAAGLGRPGGRVGAAPPGPPSVEASRAAVGGDSAPTIPATGRSRRRPPPAPAQPRSVDQAVAPIADQLRVTVVGAGAARGWSASGRCRWPAGGWRALRPGVRRGPGRAPRGPASVPRRLAGSGGPGWRPAALASRARSRRRRQPRSQRPLAHDVTRAPASTGGTSAATAAVTSTCSARRDQRRRAGPGGRRRARRTRRRARAPARRPAPSARSRS